MAAQVVNVSIGHDRDWRLGHSRLDLAKPMARAALVGWLRLATCMVLLFAVYDALGVIREERAKSRSDSDDR